ncbi:protein-disulfide reductase DsbD family protein [Marinobacter algicola]|uniref:Thio:disulfide interchange protein, putative n=1 Tax=Marinobacter algicola DG893 TaxID=443152 RepID=A6EUP7_9GAMM|nr:cytochrome c biogenesis protein CcdA [Marinobacter algicola]EDM49546.1 thio:disulfide interchange protein, putative [Marinobacter algicola DG893]
MDQFPSLIIAGQIMMAVMAGLLLNLTPCVLPAIPIKVRTILREAGSQRSHRVLAALAFSAGTLTFFLTLGGLTALLQWNWGTLFQSTVFVAVLVALMVGFAVVTWLDLPIPVPAFAASAHGRRYFEAYVSGLLSAVLAAPCAGPFLGGVLAFAVTQPAPVIMGIFGSIGLGLSLPYAVLMLKPEWLSRLPKAGPWTLAIREVLALVLLAAAVFFSASLVPKAVYPWVWWAWLALVLLWGIRRFIQGNGAVRVIAATAAGLAFAVAVVFASPLGSSVGELVWQPYSSKLLTDTKARGAPYLLEFTADWCINCKVLERTVYKEPAVAAAVRRANMVPIQVDVTASDPEKDALLTATGGQALPFAAVIDGDGTVIARFTGLFDADSLVEAINRTGNSQL